VNEKNRHSTASAATPALDKARWRRALLGAESRWPAFAAALVIIVGQARLASSLQLQPVWLLPGVAAVLLIASIGFYISPAKPTRVDRVVSIGLAGVLVIANAGSFACSCAACSWDPPSPRWACSPTA